jgi:hypothetical protein
MFNGLGVGEMMTAEAIKVYSFPVHDDGGVERPDEALDRAIRRYMADHGVSDYGEAFDAVRADPNYADAVRRYAAN